MNAFGRHMLPVDGRLHDHCEAGEPGFQGRAVGDGLARRRHRAKLVLAFMGLTPLEKVPCFSGEPLIISDNQSE